MIRAEQDTVLPLPSRDGIAAGARLAKYFPALPLQMRCEMVPGHNTRTCWILHVVGTVDSRTSEELLEKIELLLGAGNQSRLIVDLDGVVYMDSSGVGALLAGLRGSQNRQVRLTLCGLRKPLHDILERTRLAGLFEIRPTVEQALCC
jgi:anti-sigma B factor antagonist